MDACSGWGLGGVILKRHASSRVVMTIMHRPLADARGSEKTTGRLTPTRATQSGAGTAM